MLNLGASMTLGSYVGNAVDEWGKYQKLYLITAGEEAVYAKTEETSEKQVIRLEDFVKKQPGG